jgi:hypothetical protein
MQVSLLEILREIPDHRRREGKRFDLSTVLLYAILAMVAGANSYRQMHEKAYPATSGEINILYVIGLFAMPIARSERNAAWRFARRLKRKTNSSR